MKLPFMVIKRSTWLDKHNYRVSLENEVITLRADLAAKQRVLDAVQNAAPVVADKYRKEGVAVGRQAMKRDLLRHVRSKVVQ